MRAMISHRQSQIKIALDEVAGESRQLAEHFSRLPSIWRRYLAEVQEVFQMFTGVKRYEIAMVESVPIIGIAGGCESITAGSCREIPA
jgi:hypothetical protein